jgi:cytochrome c-type biogenesis protein CcmE
MSAHVPPSRATAIKIVATVIAVMVPVGFVLRASMKEGAEYYKHVDEVMGNIGRLRGKTLQVHGHVVEGSIEQAKGTLLYRFKIESRPPRGPGVITARYTGLVPDTFKGGAEVVATGKLTPDDQLDVVPDGIMAKCPSKYDADKQGPLKADAVKLGDGVAQKL